MASPCSTSRRPRWDFHCEHMTTSCLVFRCTGQGVHTFDRSTDGQLANMCFAFSFVSIMSCDCTGMLIAEMCIRSSGALRCRVYYRGGNNISPLSVRTSLLSPYFHMLSVLDMHTRYYTSVRMRKKQHVLSRASNFRSKRCIRYVIYFPVPTQFNLCVLRLLIMFA